MAMDYPPSPYGIALEDLSHILCWISRENTARLRRKSAKYTAFGMADELGPVVISLGVSGPRSFFSAARERRHHVRRFEL